MVFIFIEDFSVLFKNSIDFQFIVIIDTGSISILGQKIKNRKRKGWGRWRDCKKQMLFQPVSYLS